MVVTAAALHTHPDAAEFRLDLPGGLLSVAGLVSFVHGAIEASSRGWGDPLVPGALAAAVLLLAVFGCWELRSREPMIDLRLFGLAQFLWASVALTLASFALLGLLFVVP